jgi:hypothetical protein
MVTNRLLRHLVRRPTIEWPAELGRAAQGGAVLSRSPGLRPEPNRLSAIQVQLPAHVGTGYFIGGELYLGDGIPARDKGVGRHAEAQPWMSE